MALVTDAEVKEIIDTNRDTTPFIDVADLLITESLSGKGLSNARLTKIELYLAAHFATVTEERGGLTRSGVGDAVEAYNVEPGKGLLSTRYGQQAIALDSSGTLTSLSREALKAEFRVV